MSYWFGTARLIAGLGASELPRERAPGLYARLDRLCSRLFSTHPPMEDRLERLVRRAD